MQQVAEDLAVGLVVMLIGCVVLAGIAWLVLQGVIYASAVAVVAALLMSYAIGYEVNEYLSQRD